MPIPANPQSLRVTKESRDSTGIPIPSPSNDNHTQKPADQSLRTFIVQLENFPAAIRNVSNVNSSAAYPHSKNGSFTICGDFIKTVTAPSNGSAKTTKLTAADLATALDLSNNRIANLSWVPQTLYLSALRHKITRKATFYLADYYQQAETRISESIIAKTGTSADLADIFAEAVVVTSANPFASPSNKRKHKLSAPNPIGTLAFWIGSQNKTLNHQSDCINLGLEISATDFSGMVLEEIRQATKPASEYTRTDIRLDRRKTIANDDKQGLGSCRRFAAHGDNSKSPVSSNTKMIKPRRLDDDGDFVFSFASGNQLSIFTHTKDAVLTTTLTVSNGILSVSSSTAAEIRGNGTNNVTIEGSKETINEALSIVVFSPDRDFKESDKLTLTTTDKKTERIEAYDQVEIRINNDVDGLVVEPDRSQTSAVIRKNETATGRISAFTTNSQDISFRAEDGSNGTVTIDSKSGEFSYTPKGNFKGDDKFAIAVSDGKRDDRIMVNIGVEPANELPSGVIPFDATLDDDGDFTFSSLRKNQIVISGFGPPQEILETTLDINNGILSIPWACGAEIIDNGTGHVILKGPKKAINDALSLVVFTPDLSIDNDTLLSIRTSKQGRFSQSDIQFIALTLQNQRAKVRINKSKSDVSPVIDQDETATGRIIAQASHGMMVQYHVGECMSGSVKINPRTGEYFYQPLMGFQGSDRFKITVTGQDCQDEVMIEVLVAPPQKKPDLIFRKPVTAIEARFQQCLPGYANKPEQIRGSFSPLWSGEAKSSFGSWYVKQTSNPFLAFATKKLQLGKAPPGLGLMKRRRPPCDEVMKPQPTLTFNDHHFKEKTICRKRSKMRVPKTFYRNVHEPPRHTH